MNINKTMLAIFSISSAILFVLSCELPTEAPTTGTIAGITYDASNSQPLSGVAITTEPITFSKTTDSNGSFKIEDVKPGDYTLQASKTGYETNFTTIKVVAGGTASADLKLTPIAPKLSVTPTSLDFGKYATSLPFTISNTSEGTLDWKITENADWITSLTPTSGLTTTESTSVTVNVSRKGKDLGDYEESISISSNGGSATIIVKMIVPNLDDPQLSVTPAELDFGKSLTEMTFNISNKGSGTLTWGITWDESWITSVSPPTGDTTPTEVTVTIDRSGMEPGLYTDNLKISSNGGIEYVTVKMEIASAPVLSVTPQDIDLGTGDAGDSFSKTFTIKNTGTGTLTGTISKSASWLSLSSILFSLEAGPTKTITVSGTFPPYSSTDNGNFSSNISISSNGGDSSVNVHGVVTKLDLEVIPTDIDLGTDDAGDSFSKTFTIKNTGTGTLTGTISESASWLNLSSTSFGLGAGESKTITASGTFPSYSSTSNGNFNCNISITSNAGNENVYVHGVVNPEPELYVDPTDIDLGTGDAGDSFSKTFTIKNTGTGTLTGTISESASWLNLSSTSFSLGAGESKTITASGTFPSYSSTDNGNFSFNISISSNGGDGSVYVHGVVNLVNGNLEITVTNWNDKSAKGAEILLYRPDWTPYPYPDDSVGIVGIDNKVTISNIPEDNDYKAEVYYNGEFWGGIRDIQIVAGQTERRTIKRTTPLAYKVTFSGTWKYYQIHVINQEADDLSVEVHLWVQSEDEDYYKPKEVTVTKNGGEEMIEFLNCAESGEKYKLEVKSYIHGEYQLTDSWDWISIP